MGLLFRWVRLVSGMRWWRQFRKKRSLFRGTLMLLTVFSLHSYLLYYFEQGHHKPAFTWFDSLWLTLTTFTTVGYGDIYAKTVEGRWTTIVLGYVAGLSLFAWLASTLASRLLERTDLRRRGMVPLKLKNHTLLINIPSPQKVRLLIERLREVEKPVVAPLVVITNEYEALPFPDDDEIYFVRGSVTDPDTYQRAGISKAKRAIVLAQDNEDPHSDALTAAAISVIESLNSDVHTIAECLFESHFVLFQHVQCDQIVYTGDILVKLLVQETEDEGAARAVTRLLDPEGNEFYSAPIGPSTEGRTFQELLQTLLDHNEPYLPVGYRRDGEVELNPPRDTTLQPKDDIIFLSLHRPNWKSMETRLFGKASSASEKAPTSSATQTNRSRKKRRKR